MESMSDTTRGQLRSAAGQEMLAMISAVEFGNFDKDNDGLLNFEELVGAMTSMYSKIGIAVPTESKIRKAMRVYDKDHSGTIDATEFQDLFAAVMLKAKKPRLPPQVQDVKEKALSLFDALAASSEGKLAKRDFAVVAQQMLAPFMQMGVMAATMNPDAPPFFKWGPQLNPALSRSVASFDVGRGLGKILDLIFDLIDADRCGTVERHDVKLFFDDIGTIINEGPQGMPLVMELFFRIVDKNADGKLSLEEAQGLTSYLVEMLASLITSVLDIVETTLSSQEVMGVGEQMVLTRGRLTPLDANADGLLSRDEFAAGVEGVLPQVTMALEMQKTQFEQMFTQAKAMRQNLAQAESSFTMGVLMRGMEWMSGGVDEATFLARTVPAYREQIRAQSQQNVERAMQGMQAWQQLQVSIEGQPCQLAFSGAVTGSPQGQALLTRVMEVYQAKYIESAPEICRQIFRLLDIDNSGTITRREVTVLKAVMDGVLRLGSLCTEGSMSAEDRAEMTRIYPDLFAEGNNALPEQERLRLEARTLALALFDTLDRNGDGTLSPDEIAGFVVKVSSFTLQITKVYISCMFECFKEIGKEALAQLWASANMNEISKEEFPAMLQTLPMMLMSTMMANQQSNA